MPRSVNMIILKTPLPPLMEGIMPMIKTILSSSLIALLLGGCQQENDVADNSTNTKHDHQAHHHGLLNIESVGKAAPAPMVTLNAVEDSMNGWNLHIQVENFTFTPEHVNSEVKVGKGNIIEGHAHLYVDNYQWARLYSPWYHLKNLTPGEHILRVSLNTNDHAIWASADEEISSSVIIFQKTLTE